MTIQYRAKIREYNALRSRENELTERLQHAEAAAERAGDKYGAVPARTQEKLGRMYDELFAVREELAALRLEAYPNLGDRG